MPRAKRPQDYYLQRLLLQEGSEQQERKLAYFKNGTYIEKVNLALTLIDVLFKLEKEFEDEEVLHQYYKEVAKYRQ